MKTFLSIIPEIVFVVGTTAALAAMWSMMGWEYAAFFGGAILILVSAYLHNVMNVQIEEDF